MKNLINKYLFKIDKSNKHQTLIYIRLPRFIGCLPATLSPFKYVDFYPSINWFIIYKQNLSGGTILWKQIFSNKLWKKKLH